MFENLEQIDQRLLIFFNGIHSPWADPVMWWISNKYIWIPMYLLIVYFIFKKYGLRAILFLIGIILCFAVGDLLSEFIKHTVHRFRPTYNAVVKTQIHTVYGYVGGMYGYVSSHATNTLGFAMITSLILKNRHYSIFIFSWSLLVCYSRMYLGVHYPFDLFSGALLGCTVAFSLYQLISFFERKYSHKIAFLKKTSSRKRNL